MHMINWKIFLIKRLWPISGSIRSQDSRCLGRHSNHAYLETLRHELALLVTRRRNLDNEDLKQLLHWSIAHLEARHVPSIFLLHQWSLYAYVGFMPSQLDFCVNLCS